MADLDQRVATLEHEVAALKSRVAANDEELRSIPDLIKIEFRLANSQTARLSRDVADLQRGLGDLTAKVDAMPRVIAEMLTERDRKR
jgi:uncharacterized protein YceH (UPF0502 family)